MRPFPRRLPRRRLPFVFAPGAGARPIPQEYRQEAGLRHGYVAKP